MVKFQQMKKATIFTSQNSDVAYELKPVRKHERSWWTFMLTNAFIGKHNRRGTR